MPDDPQNQPRFPITPFRAGDSITESRLGKLTKAVSDRRTFSAPPRQIIPVVTKIVPFVSWCYIDKQNPTTTQKLNSTPLTASTDAFSFTGTTVCKKIIFNFERQVVFQKGSAGHFLPDVGSFYFGKATFSSAGTVSGSFRDLAGNPVLQGQIRYQAITSAFVTANQNWNNQGSLSLQSIGTTEGGSIFTVFSSNVSVLTNLSLTAPINANDLSLSTGATFGADLSLYGIMIDVTAASSSVVGSVSPGLTQLGLAITASSSSKLQPRLVYA